MNCTKCHKLIHKARIQALPDTRTCVKCSSVGKWYTRPVITGKTTYSEVEVIKDPETAKEMHKLDKRGRQGFGSALYRVRR
jgi:phage FluMu protein Com